MLTLVLLLQDYEWCRTFAGKKTFILFLNREIRSLQSFQIFSVLFYRAAYCLKFVPISQGSQVT